MTQVIYPNQVSQLDDPKSRFVLIIPKGQYLTASLEQVMVETGITGAEITGIGAVVDPDAYCYDQAIEGYKPLPLSGCYELTSVVGNISMLNGKPFAHLHVSLCDGEGRLFGGHFGEAKIAVTCELVITPLPYTLHRGMDDDLKVNLIKPGNGQ